MIDSDVDGHDHVVDVGQEAYDVLRIVAGEIEAMFMRGMSAATNENINRLSHSAEQLQGMGAEHLASRLGHVVEAIKSNSSEGALLLLRTQTTLRVFERVMSLRAAEMTLSEVIDRQSTSSETALSETASSDKESEA